MVFLARLVLALDGAHVHVVVERDVAAVAAVLHDAVVEPEVVLPGAVDLEHRLVAGGLRALRLDVRAAEVVQRRRVQEQLPRPQPQLRGRGRGRQQRQAREQRRPQQHASRLLTNPTRSIQEGGGVFHPFARYQSRSRRLTPALKRPRILMCRL